MGERAVHSTEIPRGNRHDELPKSEAERMNQNDGNSPKGERGDQYA